MTVPSSAARRYDCERVSPGMSSIFSVIGRKPVLSRRTSIGRCARRPVSVNGVAVPLGSPSMKICAPGGSVASVSVAVVTTGATTGASTFARLRAMKRVADMTTNAVARPAITWRRRGAGPRGADAESMFAGVSRAGNAAESGAGRGPLDESPNAAPVGPGADPAAPALVTLLDQGMRAAPAARLGARLVLSPPKGTLSASKLGSRLSAASTSFPCAIAFFSVARSAPKTDSSHNPMLLEVGRSSRVARKLSSASENACAVPKRETRWRESAWNNDLVELAWYVLAQSARRLDSDSPDRIDGARVGVAQEQAAAGQTLPKDDAQTEDVGLSGDDTSIELFGRAIGVLPFEYTGDGSGRIGVTPLTMPKSSSFTIP